MPRDSTPFSDFSVHVALGPDGGTDVAVFGELDLATADAFEAALHKAIAERGEIAIDLRACPFVDSRGIAVLIKAALRLHEEGRRVRLHGVQARVMHVLELAGITKMEQLEVEPQAG